MFRDFESYESGPDHLDRTGEQWWEEPPTHVLLDNGGMIYNGPRPILYPSPEKLAAKRAKRQAALEQYLQDNNYAARS